MLFLEAKYAMNTPKYMICNINEAPKMTKLCSFQVSCIFITKYFGPKRPNMLKTANPNPIRIEHTCSDPLTLPLMPWQWPPSPWTCSGWCSAPTPPWTSASSWTWSGQSNEPGNESSWTSWFRTSTQGRIGLISEKWGKICVQCTLLFRCFLVCLLCIKNLSYGNRKS